MKLSPARRRVLGVLINNPGLLSCAEVATALNVAGNLMLTRMNVWGWIVRLLVNVLYVLYATQIESGGPMVVNHIIFMAINVEGWRKWRQQERRTQ